MENIRERFARYCQELGEGLLEREETVRIVLLAALSGHNTFLLGEPGIAKSLLAQRLQYLIAEEEAVYFEYLMNQFSEPEQLFGPLDLQELKEGRYEIKTGGYLPTAHIAFLDEIWKANSAIQNTLLGILNEKKFHNGAKREEVPLLAFLCASNELPAQGAELEALWDRITVRLKCKPLQQSDNFKKLLNAPSSQRECRVSEPLEVADILNLRDQISELPLGPTAEDAILRLRQKLHDLDEPIFVSDRRWQQISQLIRASALVNGHSEPDIIDASVMLHSVWNKEEEQELLRELWTEILAAHAIGSDLDIHALEDEIGRYHRKVQEHYAQEELVVDEGFIPLVKPLVFDSNRKYIAVRQDSWQELQNNPQYFQHNWWQPAIRWRQNNNNAGIWRDGDTSCYCMVDPQQTNNFSTQITRVNNGSWTGKMELKKRNASFDTAKFLEQNRAEGQRGIANVSTNKKLFAAWEGQRGAIEQRIAAMVEEVERLRDEKTEPYRQNFFCQPEYLRILTAKAAKHLDTLEQLRLQVDMIAAEYREARQNTEDTAQKIKSGLKELDL